jgi:hypothetical protein
MKPIVSSIMAAKLFVSRCVPLVWGGDRDSFERNSSDFLIAGARSLRTISDRTTQEDNDILDIAMN